MGGGLLRGTRNSPPKAPWELAPFTNWRGAHKQFKGLGLNANLTVSAGHAWNIKKCEAKRTLVWGNANLTASAWDTKKCDV